MSQRSVEEILEELTGLMLAWPEAPREVWMVLHDELAEAQNAQEQAPRPLETHRGRTSKKHRRPAGR